MPRRKRRLVDSAVMVLGSMVIAGHAEGLGDALILDGIFKGGACFELADGGPLQGLPGRLRGGDAVAARSLQLLATRGDFVAGYQKIDPAFAEVHADAVAGDEKG